MSLTGLGEAFDFLSKAADKIWPDKTEAEKAKAAMMQAQLQGQLQEVQDMWDNAKQQAVVNAAEAANSNIFVAGWRPFVGWCCGGAFAYAFIVQPFLIFGCTVFHWPLDTKQLPVLDLTTMLPVLLGMLGLGGLRTAEKIKGAAPSTHA